jgi:glycosyltransferase involved in cell wall biosynthesis
VTAAPLWSFVWPVYDEAAVLPTSWPALVLAADALGGAWECVAVDDGSRDASGAWLRARAADDPRLVARGGATNRGKGAALREGVHAARGRWIVTMDVDLATELEALPRAAARLTASTPFLYGDRRHPDSQLLVRQPLLRENLGRGFAWLARRLCVKDIRDGTCGFKAFDADVARALHSRTHSDGWAHDVELFVAARELGIPAEPLPVRWSHRSGSKVRIAGAVREAGTDLLRIRRRRAAGLYR